MVDQIIIMIIVRWLMNHSPLYWILHTFLVQTSYAHKNESLRNSFGLIGWQLKPDESRSSKSVHYESGSTQLTSDFPALIKLNVNTLSFPQRWLAVNECLVWRSPDGRTMYAY